MDYLLIEPINAYTDRLDLLLNKHSALKYTKLYCLVFFFLNVRKCVKTVTRDVYLLFIYFYTVLEKQKARFSMET